MGNLSSDNLSEVILVALKLWTSSAKLAVRAVVAEPAVIAVVAEPSRVPTKEPLIPVADIWEVVSLVPSKVRLALLITEVEPAYKILPAVNEVWPVPPLATATVPVTFAALAALATLFAESAVLSTFPNPTSPLTNVTAPVLDETDVTVFTWAPFWIPSNLVLSVWDIKPATVSVATGTVTSVPVDEVIDLLLVSTIAVPKFVPPPPPTTIVPLPPDNAKSNKLLTPSP